MFGLRHHLALTTQAGVWGKKAVAPIEMGSVMNLQSILKQLVPLLEEGSFLPPEIAGEAVALRDRLETGQLHLAVLGQFKRGKSTLINALLGAEILPSGVLPVTLLPVFSSYGPHAEVGVYFQNGHSPESIPLSHLGEYVNEANNPHNVKQVSRIELRYPAKLLEHGIIVIDTPGVGSTHQHNTDTTLEFLPQCDAALIVFSADPPITAAEVSFLQSLQPHVAKLFFVLNKIDYLDAHDAVEARLFLHKTIQTRLGIDSPPIFPVSARLGLRAQLGQDMAAWQQSGMADLERALLDFATTGKLGTLAEAVRRKTLNLVARADQLLALQQRARELPIEALERKLGKFRQSADEACQQRLEIFDRLTGDEKRLVEQLEAAITALREAARSELLRLAELNELPTHDENQIEAFQLAVQAYFDHERATLGNQLKNALSSVLGELTRRAQQIREDLRREAANLLEIPHFPLLAEDVVIGLQEPAWRIKRLTVPARPTSADWLLSQEARERRRARQREELVDELVTKNAEKIRWWILRTIQESISVFRQRISIEVEETIEQIDHALQAGLTQRDEQAEVQQNALAALTAYRHQLGEIRQEIEAYDEIEESAVVTIDCPAGIE